MKIDEGYTFSYFFFALAFFAFGAILAYFNIAIGIVVIAIGAIALLVKTGTIFDLEHKKIGRYSSLFGKDKIHWTSIASFKKANLDFEYISQKMNSRGTSSTVRTKTYTLTFIGENKKMVFHEYADYKLSKQVLEILENDFKIEVIDKYFQTQKEAYNRRRNRRN